MRVQITVPPNTLRSSPQSTALQYGGGRCNRQRFGIPRGHAYLTGLQMFAGHAHSRVIPEHDSNTEWLTDDGQTVEKHVVLVFDTPSFEVVFKCYNEDDSFSHTFYIDLDEV